MNDAVAAALPLVARFEAFRAAPYRDPAGVWTIGYGATHYADGRAVGADDAPLSAAAGMALLAACLGASWAAIAPRFARVPARGQAAAMLSLAFNIGSEAFCESRLLAKFNAGDIAGAAAQFFVWDKAHVQGALVTLPGLAARRAAERALFLSEGTS